MCYNLIVLRRVPKKAYKADNTEMRTIINDKGDQIIMTVSSLIKDTQDPSFHLIDDGSSKDEEDKKEDKKEEELEDNE